MFVTLDQPLLIEVSGDDAGKILHNLTTNQVLSLSVGASVETFVTDVRGWVVAHGMLFRLEESRWWLVGQHPDSEKVASHIDRYIIREDARVTDLSPLATIEFYPDQLAGGTKADTLQHIAFVALGRNSALSVAVSDSALGNCVTTGRSPDWQRLRIGNRWPIMGEDIWEKCIPQELDRNAQAISFTKGCYLGQETIARLDALGQIQKKLCLLKIDGTSVQPGAAILADDKEVGTVSSVASEFDTTFALGVIRRGYFNAGTILTCSGERAAVQL